jgi:hypothetical protein
MRTVDLQTLKSHLDAEAAILDGLDDCIVGVCNNNRLVYGYGQLLKHFLFTGMSHTEAIEYIEFNIVGLLPAAQFTILHELEFMI